MSAPADTTSTRTPAGTGSSSMTRVLRSLLRHYLHVLALCCVVSVFTTLMWPTRSYLVQLGYATCIGTLCWITMEAGRHLVDPRNCHGNPEGGRGWPKGWRGLVLTVIGILVGFYVGDEAAYWLIGPGDSDAGPANKNIIGLYITVAAGAIGSFYFHAKGRSAAMAAEIAATARDATEARLKLLETQLEPHMLFNTLANLRVLIATDPERAVAMLDRLNDYLRATLGGSRSTLHPLSQEFDRLADYLALMAVRMGRRLRCTLDLPPELRAVPVPPLLLQPLVENAIRHGLEPQVEGGEIRVLARREGGDLVIDVIDTGAGLDAGPVSTLEEREPRRPVHTSPGSDSSTQGGFGLTQVRERLRTLYGEDGTLALSSPSGGGTCATVTLPFSAAA